MEKVEIEEVEVTTIRQKFKEGKPKQPDEEVEELSVQKFDEVFSQPRSVCSDFGALHMTVTDTVSNMISMFCSAVFFA